MNTKRLYHIGGYAVEVKGLGDVAITALIHTAGVSHSLLADGVGKDLEIQSFVRPVDGSATHTIEPPEDIVVILHQAIDQYKLDRHPVVPRGHCRTEQ